MILTTEKILLNQELSLYANSPEEQSSIKTTLNQLEDAEQALRIVHDSKIYIGATCTYPAKRKENGLPLDSFREFIKSHGTRLTNRLASRIANLEKEILRQRKLNLAAARATYITLQQKSLAG